MHLKVYCQNIENPCNNGKACKQVVFHGLADSFVNKLPEFYDKLSDYERSRADRFRFECDYRSYVSMHALLRIELSKLLKTKAKSIRIGVSEYGKPFLPGIDLSFSLSSSKNLFAFVVGQSNQFLGIDIEQIKPDIDFINISRNYFSTKEQQLVLSFKNIEDQRRSFFEIWTRKEALLKAIGVGIITELSKVQVLEGCNIFSLEGVLVSNHVFKIATVKKKEALISIASSVDFFPEFINLSYILF